MARYVLDRTDIKCVFHRGGVTGILTDQIGTLRTDLRLYHRTRMKPAPAPKVPGTTDAERMSNALRMVLTVPKQGQLYTCLIHCFDVHLKYGSRQRAEKPARSDPVFLGSRELPELPRGASARMEEWRCVSCLRVQDCQLSQESAPLAVQRAASETAILGQGRNHF